MKESISGRDIAKEMKALAKSRLVPGVACVCVAVENFSDSGRKRSDKNNNLTAYVTKNGETGRAELREELGIENSKLIGKLQVMADNLVKYQSKRHGMNIKPKEPWATHNCAESNAALFLYQQGKSLSKFTVAAYELRGDVVGYKPLCKNCVQWVRNNFHVLRDYEAHIKAKT